METGAVLDGFHDAAGRWWPTPPATREQIELALGHTDDLAGEQPPLWFVAEGSEDWFWNPCRIVTEHGHDLGTHERLPADLPIGYHDLLPVDGGPTTRLVVHPPRCPPLPRAWGVATQIYALWDDGCWGIGDLGCLTRFGERLRTAGGSAMLLSPLHQPTPGDDQTDSPYWPSSRRTRSPLLLEIDGPPPPELCCDPAVLIDRNAVWRHKRGWLWQRFLDGPGPDAEPSTVAWWNARRERYGADEGAWPTRDQAGEPDSVRTLARFHEWLQERIESQVDRLARQGVALIGDLAVGFSPDGADASEFADLIASDMQIGAPPDEFNVDGQRWGLPPFVPARLRAAWYEPFIATVRATLRGMSGLRIDHVMGLFRQFWVPSGCSPRDGAYVRFPAEELLAIIAIEATRAGAFVIGEDLGTVDDEVRHALARWGIAGTRVLWFDDAPPDAWPPDCLATVTTHDLPTVAAVVGLDRDDARRRRLDAVTGGAADARTAVRAAHEALVASPAALRLVTTDDLAGATEQPNVPGTVGPPNWCRLLPLPADRIDLTGGGPKDAASEPRVGPRATD